jgi:hypothetical protein
VRKREEGAVFAYLFQWDDESLIEHLKARTTCLAIQRQTAEINGSTVVHLFLLGISDSPRGHQVALGIPLMETRRAGLQADRSAYVIISEYNYDVLPHS